MFGADREVVSQALQDCLAHPGEVLDVEYRLRDDSGSVRWAHTRARAEHEPSGQALRVNGTTADVTGARMEVAARLRAERILSRTLDASQDAFIGADESGVVTDWNPAAEAMFGWFRDEIIGQGLVERICNGDGTVLSEMFSDMSAAGTWDRRARRRKGAKGGGGLYARRPPFPCRDLRSPCGGRRAAVLAPLRARPFRAQGVREPAHPQRPFRPAHGAAQPCAAASTASRARSDGSAGSQGCLPCSS